MAGYVPATLYSEGSRDMKNSYVVEGDVVKIYFRNVEGFFLIDKDDLEKISKHTWYLNRNGYAESRTYQKEHIKAHHEVIGKPPKGLVTDHINRNRLDNRKCNLRHVTYRENGLNRGKAIPRKNPLLGIKVYRGKKRTTYSVYIHDENNVTKYYGTFRTLEEAQNKRDEIVKERNARINSLSI